MQAEQMMVQGILVPRGVVDPKAFFANTRRQRFTQYPTVNFAGLGNADVFSLKQSGIVSSLHVRVLGTLTVTPGSGTVATTSNWPYGLIKRYKLSANNMSNLVNVGGRMLRARALARNPGLTDRGVPNTVAGTLVYQGTQSLANELWGVGQNTTSIGSGTYNVDLSFTVPVAFDEELLGGALFAQTSATDIANEIDWALQSDLFILTGNAAVSLALTVFVDATVYNIPRGPSGEIVLPDLSVFHTVVEASFSNLGNTQNEITFSGQGVGKQLLAVFWDLNNSAQTGGAYLQLTTSNFGALSWGYGGNEIPETWNDGRILALQNEYDYGSNFGAAGIGVFDWASHWAMRDSIDMGSATQLRAFINPVPTMVTGNTFRYAQEIIVPGTAAGKVGSMSNA